MSIASEDDFWISSTAAKAFSIACFDVASSVVKALKVFSSAFNRSISAMYRRCEASLYDIPRRSWRAKISAWAESLSESLLP